MAQHINNISGLQGSNFRTETHGNQTVHVRENSDSLLEDLFRVVQNSGTQKQSDWLKRNLPPSFFQQPTINQNNQMLHRRPAPQPPTVNSNGLPVNHSRSRSAPVQLPPSVTLPPAQPQHAKQQSMDLIEDMQAIQLNHSGWSTPSHSQTDLANYNNFNGSNQNVSSPPAGGGANGGQPWVVTSPAKSPHPAATSSPQQQANNSPQPGHPGLQLNLQSVIGPLPQGWEMSLTSEGEIYYINHNDKSTSWFHPLNGSKHMSGPIKLSQLLPNHQAAVTNHLQMQHTLLVQQQAQQQLQQQQAAAAQQHQPGQQGSRHNGGAALPSQAYIQAELQRLQKQKDNLRRQQEEISKKESALMTGLSAPSAVAPSPMGGPSMAALSTSGVDPFLGQAPGQGGPNPSNDSHARQNSADSGLGMGPNYSLPRTPEDFLSNVDEMDSSDTGSQKVSGAPGGSSGSDLVALGGGDMDMSGMGSNNMDTHTTAMDEHDLMPSLQAEIDAELLDSQRIDNLLTWL